MEFVLGVFNSFCVVFNASFWIRSNVFILFNDELNVCMKYFPCVPKNRASAPLGIAAHNNPLIIFFIGQSVFLVFVMDCYYC